MVTKMGRTACSLLVVILMIVSMTACSTSNNQPQTTSPTVATATPTDASQTATNPPEENPYEKPITFTSMSPNAYTPNADNRTVVWLEKKFNVKITWDVLAWADYVGALPTRLASGDIPDVFTEINGTRPSSFTDYITDGVIREVSQYLGDYPNLARYLNEEHPEINKYFGEKDGKLYGVPPYYGYSRHSIIYRKDWFDAVGVKTPDNWDEFKTALKSVMQADPGGTHPYGLSVFSIAFFENSLPSFTGECDSWYQKDSKWIFKAFDSGFRDYVAYWESLYDEGILDPEWNLLKTQDVVSKFASGKIVATMDHINSGEWKIFEDPLKEANPTSDMELMLPYPQGPAGRYWVRNNGFFTIDCFSAKNDDDTFKRILAIYDWNHTDEGKMVSLYGLEGTHYTINASNEVVRNMDETNKDAYAPGSGQYPMYLGGSSQWLSKFDVPQVSANGEALAQYGITNSTMINIPLDSKTAWDDLNTRFNEVYKEWYPQFFIGQKSVKDDWDDFLQALTNAGYSDLQQYYSQYGSVLDIK
jgi:putative aldouronate transport system substrate-binding protein